MAEALTYQDAAAFAVDVIAPEALSCGEIIQLPDGRAGVTSGLAGVASGDLANAVTDGNAVPVAGATAGEVVFTLRKKGGEDAVLHVKHRDMLVEGELKPFRRGRTEKFKDLADIKVVAWGECAKALGDE